MTFMGLNRLLDIIPEKDVLAIKFEMFLAIIDI